MKTDDRVLLPRHVRHSAAILGIVMLASGCMSARSHPEGPSDASPVRAAEQRRFQAMVAIDLRALDTLLAEELTYTHTTGDVDTKASLLDALRTGRLAYDSITPADVRMRVYAGIAIVTGTARVDVRADGVARHLGIRYTEAYVRRDNRWELVVWQSTRMPEPQH